MRSKRVPDPERVRRCPQQFSWVDHRLVRLGHVRGHTAQALALYLVLVAVGDADGVSWYGDERLGVELGFSRERLVEARGELIETDLVAYQSPFYQVLALPREPATMPRLEDAFQRLLAGRAD